MCLCLSTCCKTQQFNVAADKVGHLYYLGCATFVIVIRSYCVCVQREHIDTYLMFMHLYALK